MNYLAFISVLFLLVWFWNSSLDFREYLLRFCHRACREAGYQFLDQTVVLESVYLRKGSHGLPLICRRYRFEVSEDGMDRFRGYVVMHGRSIKHFILETPEYREILH